MAPSIETIKPSRGPQIAGPVVVGAVIAAIVSLFTFMIIDLAGPDERLERAKVENQAQIENCWKMGGTAIIKPTGWLKECQVAAP